MLHADDVRRCPDTSSETSAIMRHLVARDRVRDYVLEELSSPDAVLIAISELKAESKCSEKTVHRHVKHLNDVVETDCGKLKQLICPVRGFKTLKAAYATIAGFEVMRALRKGQAAIYNLTHDIRGEARIAERAFGIGASALTEAVALIGDGLNLQTA